MSENIKEIINDLQRVADRKCYPEDILCGSIAQEWTDYITDLYEENERLNNIIKEVREYMNKHEIESVYLDCKLYETEAYKDILEILDKGV